MNNTTKAIRTPIHRRGAKDALQMPVYHRMAYEIEDAGVMPDAFIGRPGAPGRPGEYACLAPATEAAAND